jgi:phage shock protein C
MNTTDTQSAGSPTSVHDDAPHAGYRPLLRRPVDGRALAGVAAGAADYFGIDVMIVRVALLVLTFFGGAGIPLYLAGWLLIPEEGTDQSIASELIGSVSGR